LQKTAPTLQEEHANTQAAILRLQTALAKINTVILDVAAKRFPSQWATVTPSPVKIYSWVGYDIDGRTDIGWADAIRLRLQEKFDQLCRYHETTSNIIKKTPKTNKHLEQLHEKLEQARESTRQDLLLFNKDMHIPENLIAAANNLTRESGRRIRSTANLYPSIDAAIKSEPKVSLQQELILLRSNLKIFGLGTSRIHFRLNARHVINGVRAAFGIRDSGSDTRTLLQRASEKTRQVKALAVNFAALELEKNVAHRYALSGPTLRTRQPS